MMKGSATITYRTVKGQPLSLPITLWAISVGWKCYVAFLFSLNNNQKWDRKSFLVLMQSYTHVCTYEHLTDSIPASNLHTLTFSFQPCFERINFDGINGLRRNNWVMLKAVEKASWKYFQRHRLSGAILILLPEQYAPSEIWIKEEEQSECCI